MKLKNICFFMLFIPSICFAEFKSGNELKTQCNSSQLLDQGVCFGYVTAVADINTKQKVCMPSNVTIGQLQAISIKYFNDYPDRLHYSADSLVLDALSKAFPCSSKR